MKTCVNQMRRRAAGHRDDGGWAMMIVLASMMVLTIIVTVAIQVSLSSVGTARTNQDTRASLAAADSGVDDYVGRLNSSANYYLNGATSASNSLSSSSSYSWQVLSSATQIQQTGQIKLQSLGTVRGKSREVQVTLSKQSFLNYLYYTNYETIDPIATGYTGNCAVYRYNGRNTTYCPDIQFRTGDIVKGPLHSNDEVVISGSPAFQGGFDTAWNDPNKKYWYDASPTSTPSFQPGYPRYATVPFPSTNLSLKSQATRAGGGGCYYTGPTKIIFNQDGTMTITSPYTASAATGCGTFPTTTSQTIPVPTGNVIYVDNYTGSCNLSNEQSYLGFPISADTALTKGTSKLVYNCQNGDVFTQGWLKGQVTIGAANNIIVTDDLRYAGNNGSAVGTAIPTSTSGAPNSADTSGTDSLGLAASNFVEVYHPIACSARDYNNNCTSGSEVSSGVYPNKNIQIDAAIVASNDSFIVQNWSMGSAENVLTVLGGIVQQYRGPVGTSGGSMTGYLKNYNYDTRLKFSPPPYLADLASSAWGVSGWSEVHP